MANFADPTFSEEEEDADIDRKLAAAGYPNAFPVTDSPGGALTDPTRSAFDDAAAGGAAGWQAHIKALSQPIKPDTLLGSNPQPTTPEGKAAQAAIEKFQAAIDAGVKLPPGDHAAWVNHLHVLDHDFTKQRLALDAQRQPSPAVPVKPAAAPAPITREKATATAQKLIQTNREMLSGLGVAKVELRSTKAASGVEFGEDGTLRISPSKLADSMNNVAQLQAKKGITGTPEDWVSQVLVHEGIHAADVAVAKAHPCSPRSVRP